MFLRFSSEAEEEPCWHGNQSQVDSEKHNLEGSDWTPHPKNNERDTSVLISGAATLRQGGKKPMMPGTVADIVI
jgi:hypothetical protein